MVIKDACNMQAEMSEDGGHSDDGESDGEDDEQDGILVRPLCKLLLQIFLKVIALDFNTRPPLHTQHGSMSFHPDTSGTTDIVG